MITHNGTNHNLAIEVKFATDYPQGGVESKSNVKSTFRTDTDTSTSQLIESRMNRDSRYSIIVLDHTLNLKSKTPEIVFHPDAQGFIVKVNLLDGDFSPLYTAYEVARAMTIASAPINLDYSVLEYLGKRPQYCPQTTRSNHECRQNNLKSSYQISQGQHEDHK